MHALTEAEMYAAVEARDAKFDGQFVYGVLTTRVFCRPSCPSKQAKRENMRFFSTKEDATNAGFRPCQRCQRESIEARLIASARFIEAHKTSTLSLADLAKQAALSPSYYQKAFKTKFGLSPKDYQNGLRLKTFKDALKTDASITDAIYSAGFGSSSRVYGDSHQKLGMSPKAYRDGGKDEQISYICSQTDLGLIMIAATHKGVCFVQFGDSETQLLEALLQEFPKATLAASDAHNSPRLVSWLTSLNLYFRTGKSQPDIPLDMRGTAFQIQVWKILTQVKDGETLSYSELAERLGKPKAVRAVASACARNKIGILIPCHRVLRSDGSPGGYRWGLARKKALIEKEQANKEIPTQGLP